MANLLKEIANEMIFWMAWIIIPLVMEIIPAIGGFLILLKKRFFIKKDAAPIRLPEITLIIPVYNSAGTLRRCLASVDTSNYPNELIHIMLVNNQSTDNSFDIYTKCQEDYPDLSMQWLNSKQGKSKALNMALFNSEGKYIIHIDSDGYLHQEALRNMVMRFEQNPSVHCLTGAVMTDPDVIENTEGFFKRLWRKTEMFEYCQAFLAGRNFESELNSIYTLSGAFSAFRKSAILKTQLYNTDTVCEDTHVTFQVRKMLKKGVHICENALFFVEPIESFDKLYTQRQRWQRGEIEVSHMFLKDQLKASKGLFSNFLVRILMYDHTFAFPRMIWYFALICLAFMNYPMRLIVGSIILIYLLYVLSSFLYYINICTYLKDFPDLRRYYRRKWYLCFLLPIYSFVIFLIRFAGIINCINQKGSWKTLTLSEEWEKFKSILRHDFAFVVSGVKKLKDALNHRP